MAFPLHPVVVLSPGREGTGPPSFAPSPPSFITTHDFFADVTQIFYFFAVPNCTKVGKFAASIECPNTESASASERQSPLIP